MEQINNMGIHVSQPTQQSMFDFHLKSQTSKTQTFIIHISVMGEWSDYIWWAGWIIQVAVIWSGDVTRGLGEERDWKQDSQGAQGPPRCLPAVVHFSLPSLFAVFWFDDWVNDRLEDRRRSGSRTAWWRALTATCCEGGGLNYRK